MADSTAVRTARRRGSARARSATLVALGAAGVLTAAACVLGFAGATADPRAAGPAVARPQVAATASPTTTPTAAPASATPAPTPGWRVAAIDTGPGYPGVPRWSVPAIVDRQIAAWSSQAAGLPSTGSLGSVIVPATASHFTARPALVYLPPAALTAHPRRLPVVIAFSGQSRTAGPIDLVRQAHLAAMMDRIAAAGHGAAPIVVVPDQLGPGSPNPMCVDSPLGRVATYVLRDVRTWVLQHLPVQTDRRGWTVAGFSQGGTCAIQFAAGHPEVFGSFVDVSGELAPKNGSIAHTIAVGFGGSRARYEAAAPLRLLAAGRRFPPMRGYFAVGAHDLHYGPVEPALQRGAIAAGIPSTLWVIPNTRHNWTVGAAGLSWGFTQLRSWWGLDGPAPAGPAPSG